MNKIVLVVLGASLALTGCDKGVVSVSGGVEQGTETQSAQTVQRTKELSQAKQDAVYIEKKLFPVIAQASDGVTKGRADFKFSTEVLLMVVDHQRRFNGNYGLSRPLPEYLKIENAVGLTVGEYAIMESLQGRDTLGELELFATALAINIATSPVTGWVSGFNNDRALNEMRSYATVGMLSSEVMALVANELASRPVEREQLLGNAWLLIDKYRFNHSEFFSQYNASRLYTRDLTGSSPAPVHFSTSDGLDVSVGSGGVQIAQYGDEWFGAGKMDGKQYTARVSVSKGSSMKKGTTNETGTGSNQRQNAGAGVNAG